MAALTNVIGDALFCVWPLKAGCAGAAGATAIATLISWIFMIKALAKKKLLPKIKLPKNLNNLIPKKILVPYKFFVFDREYDDLGNKITFIKNLCGRRTFYVEKLQK